MKVRNLSIALNLAGNLNASFYGEVNENILIKILMKSLYLS